MIKRLRQPFRRFDRRVFWAVFLFTSLFFIIARADFFFGAGIHEAGDDAANALQIMRAKAGRETLGNYSRFEFHHPGPAFFYVYALGEIILRDVLRVVAAPGNAHVLTGVLLQSFFFAAALGIIARYRRSVWLLVLLVAAGLIHFRLAERAFLSTWPPHQLLMPFLCLMVAGGSVATGRLVHLPLLTLASAFLVHGHVSQPLFVGVVWIVAGVLCFAHSRRSKDAAGRHRGRAFLCYPGEARRLWISVAIAVVFGIPLAIEAFRGSEGNFALILAHVRNYQGQYKSLGESLFYFAHFFTYWSYHAVPAGNWHTFLAENYAALSAWLAILFAFAGFAFLLKGNGAIRARGAGILKLGEPAKRFWIDLIAITIATFAASIFWGVKMDGPMWSFNSFFNYAILFLFLVPAVVLLEWILRGRKWARPAVLTCAVVTLVLLPRGFAVPMEELSRNNGMGDEAVSMLAQGQSPPKRQLLWHSPTVWVQTASLALALERRGIDFGVRRSFTLLVGKDHLGSPAESLRNPGEHAAWLLATKEELAAFVDDSVDLGHGVYAQQWRNLRRLGPGTEIPFNHLLMFLDGFSEAETEFRWSSGPRASVFLPLQATGRDARINFVLHGLVDGRTKLAQRVIPRVGDKTLGEWQVAGKAEHSLVIPAALVAEQLARSGGVIVDFDLPDAVAPKTLGIGDDTRVLGIAVYRATVME